jgi:hypothetical protein
MEGASAERRSELLCSKEPEVAIFAAWDECLAALTPFEPPAGSQLAQLMKISTDERVYRIPKKALDELDRRVSTHVRVCVPAFWQKELAGGWTLSGFFSPGVVSSSLDAYFEQTFIPLLHQYVSHPRDMSVQLGERTCRVKRNCDSAQLPIEQLDGDCTNGIDEIAVAFNCSHVFVAYADWFGRCGYLACLDRKTGRTEWKSRLWQSKSWDEMPRTTAPSVAVDQSSFDVRVGGGLVTVFGTAERGAYIESFTTDGGDCVLRFSSSYWERRGAFEWWPDK